LLIKSVSEIVSTTSFDFNADGFFEFNTEGLGTLLEHTHEFLGVFKVVVHEGPVIETSG
jgi:hypothetical protein